MSREWEPGDVAMIEVGCHANRFIGLFTHRGRGWRYGIDKWVADDPAIVTARPLVVIDPEDREQVDRLLDAVDKWGLSSTDAISNLQAALREFANPTPPKPEEPLGLGAVVEDAEGVRWVRIDSGHWDHDWVSVHYDDITAVRVLSEGVTP